MAPRRFRWAGARAHIMSLTAMGTLSQKWSGPTGCVAEYLASNLLLTLSNYYIAEGSLICSCFARRESCIDHTLMVPEAPNVPLFLGTRKKTLELPISARPPKKRSPPPKKRSTTSPSSIQRKAGLLRLKKKHSFADMCARFADICARFAL